MHGFGVMVISNWINSLFVVFFYFFLLFVHELGNIIIKHRLSFLGYAEIIVYLCMKKGLFNCRRALNLQMPECA